MNINKTFIKIWEVDLNDKIHYYSRITKYLCPNLQVLLLSDGSLTNNLNILGEVPIFLKLIKEEEELYSFSVSTQSSIFTAREILLTHNKEKNFIFAKTYYIKNIPPINLTNNNKPLGKSLIEAEIEIYRKIKSIYYGYSRTLEKKFQFQGPVWGRSYYILCNQKFLTLIHEFFRPVSLKKSDILLTIK
jgi:chorismate-pyruvate lyase|uniref:Chorismate lyase n=1 Tax=Kumanoa mahlacensis TaxID=1196387 RepID=A0A8K1YUA9_9FLOR|nr:Hypothetical protein Ycf21 [Kumanoa mahlacensis]